MRYTSNRYATIPRKDWGGALTGASTGAKMGSSIGMAFGPIGGAIGLAAGAVGGALFGHFGEEKRDKQQRILDSEMYKAKQAELTRSKLSFANTTKKADAAYLGNLDMNNQKGLFLPEGGKVQEMTNRHVKLAEAGAADYRKAIASFDSLRTILRPVLQKSGKDHLDSSAIKKTLGDKGYSMYNTIANRLSNSYTRNKALGVELEDFQGSLENPNDKISDYLYGKRIDQHKFPNAEFPIIDVTDRKNPIELARVKAYADTTGMPSYMRRANGGKVAAKGMNLGSGDKLLINSNGGTTGTHETGDNVPISKNGKVVAVAEPGEVLVNDKDMPNTPFVLSKRIGRNGKMGKSFANEYMELEAMKNIHNEEIIDNRQANLIDMNNKMVSSRNRMAAFGKLLGPVASKQLPRPKMNLSPTKQILSNVSKVGTNIGIQRSLDNFIPTKQTINGNISVAPSTKTGIQKYSGTLPTVFSKSTPTLLDRVKGLDGNTIMGAAGTIGNLLLTNKAQKRQSDLIQSSLNDALSYSPNMAKNYLLNDNVDVNDSVSAVNQGYNSVVSGLDGIDPAIASALKNRANMSRVSQLGGIYGNRNRMVSDIRNRNVAGIAATSNANTELGNQTALMKLNAKMAANEQLGELENARLSSTQGAISEFNTILRDKDIMNSLKARWKDSIGTDFIKTSDTQYKYGGRLRRRKTMSY